MMEAIKSKDILMVSSSVRDESSYAWAIDDALGVHVLDRFTYSLLNNAKDLDPVTRNRVSIRDLIERMNERFLSSTPHIREDLFNRPASETLFVDFFTNQQEVRLGVDPIAIDAAEPRLPEREALKRLEPDEERPAYEVKFTQPTLLETVVSAGAFLGLAALILC